MSRYTEEIKHIGQGRDVLDGAGASRVSSYGGTAWARAWLSPETILAP